MNKEQLVEQISIMMDLLNNAIASENLADKNKAMQEVRANLNKMGHSVKYEVNLYE